MRRFRFIFFLIWSSSIFSAPEPSLEMETPSAPVEITGTFSVMNPSRLILSSREYTVSYSKNLLGISAFQLGFSIPTQAYGAFQLYPFARIGYARNQGTYSLTSQEGINSSALVTLHWVPLSAGIRTEYSIPDFDLIRPYLLISGGTEWLTQRGEAPGLSETFWIPYYNVGLGLSFGSFSFSMNLQNGLKEDQEAKTLSYDLTIHFLL